MKGKEQILPVQLAWNIYVCVCVERERMGFVCVPVLRARDPAVQCGTR